MKLSKPDVIIKIFGGLGNQMFQYAFGQKLKKMFGVAVGYDLLDFEFYNLRNFELNNFSVDVELATEKFSKKFRFSRRPAINYLINKVLLNRNNYFYEPKVDENAITLQSENYFWGYWQFANFYDDILDSLRGQFNLNMKLSEESSKYRELIQSSNSVSIHIRKSDYLLKKNNYFTACGVAYYTEAIAIVNSRIEKPTYFIFSDDFDWVRANLGLKGEDYVYVQTGSKKATVEDFVLMKKCRNNIIANSTFSWWAAYLNDYDKKIVICPKKWYNNSDKTLNLEEWVILNNE